MITNNQPDGIFLNGDLWYEERQEEDGITWFAAYFQNTDPKEGADYETKEIPERFPLFTMTIFPDGTPESFVKEYMLARKIGDSRFGNQCQHARSKRSYCPDCLRKVI